MNFTAVPFRAIFEIRTLYYQPTEEEKKESSTSSWKSYAWRDKDTWELHNAIINVDLKPALENPKKALIKEIMVRCRASLEPANMSDWQMEQSIRIKYFQQLAVWETGHLMEESVIQGGWEPVAPLPRANPDSNNWFLCQRLALAAGKPWRPE